jgi:hypothetical protein
VDLLELALPTLDGIQLSPVEPTWRRADTALCLVGDVALGLLSTDCFGRGGRVAEAVRGFHVVQLAPMLVLPRMWREPDPAELVHAVGRLLERARVWALWCEPDCDQAPVLELALDPQQLAQRLVDVLSPIGEGRSLEDRTFVAYRGIEA